MTQQIVIDDMDLLERVLAVMGDDQEVEVVIAGRSFMLVNPDLVDIGAMTFDNFADELELTGLGGLFGMADVPRGGTLILVQGPFDMPGITPETLQVGELRRRVTAMEEVLERVLRRLVALEAQNQRLGEQPTFPTGGVPE